MCSGDTQPLLVAGEARGELRWQESTVGSRVLLDCPCPQGSIARQASRVCAGDASSAGVWMQANVTACQFSSLAWDLCNVEVRSNDGWCVAH